MPPGPVLAMTSATTASCVVKNHKEQDIRLVDAYHASLLGTAFASCLDRSISDGIRGWEGELHAQRWRSEGEVHVAGGVVCS
jgi:hypothetical protein